MRRLSLTLLVMAIGFGAGAVGETLAAFSGTTDNAGNSFEAAASFGSCANPGSQVLTPSADTRIEEDSASTNFGTQATLLVRSRSSSRNYRTLVQFSLPAIQSGCALKVAALRLHASASDTGRTIEAYRAAASWTETGATWNNQPGTAGTAATVTSTLGWNEWAVTTQVNAMYGGSNNGFLLRDATEGTFSAPTQTYSSREGSKPPELVVTFGEPDSVPCTGETVTADRDARVGEGSGWSNFGTSTTLRVRSQDVDDTRSLIGFPLPTIPSGCDLAGATLRVNASASDTGRTIDAYRVNASWTETGVTWNNQPATTGSAASATSATGWNEWEVTSHVQSMYSGSNHGFLIRDANEDNSFARTQDYSSREGASPPELVLTYTATPPAAPGAPSGLSATAVSETRIDLSWTDNANDEDGFKVERAPGGTGSWEQIDVLAPNAASYSNTGLSSNTAYDYRVRAFNAGGNSAYSNTASATTPPPAPPDAPSALSATAASTSRIDLFWTDNASNEDGFKIERSPGGMGSWTEIATVGANVTTHPDTGLPQGTTYDYRVRAYNAGGNSAYSNTASATTLACAAPGTQTVLSVADAMVREDSATSNFGTSSFNFGVRSESAGNNRRSLVSFTLPSIPANCVVAAATLRLHTSSGETGRTLQAFQVAASWIETGVTWSNQPGTTGSAATAASVASGWVEWAVTSIVQAQYSGSNNGFLVRDSSESSSTARNQTMHPRENTNDPELVITFG